MNLEALLPLVNRPSRYSGNEYNIIRKDWDAARLRMVFAFPDLYEIGMSHQGLQVLYHTVNRRKEYLAERVYAPDLDFERLLREKGERLFSLESRRPLADFDLLGITLPYELCYTNILTILDCAGIPFRAAERDSDAPLVIAGGPCAFHPEPVADFFDAILLGDGEEAILEIADCVCESKEAGLDRAGLLARLSEIQGVYVPVFFEPSYGADGEFQGMIPRKDGYRKVVRRILSDLDSVDDPLPPLAPLKRIVHDRLGVEVARGCTRGCRFCQAGVIYRPVRERSPERVMNFARQGIAQSGFDELAMLSLSTGDYSCLPGLLTEMMDTFADRRVSVSMPSMRVGTLSREIMDQIKRVRKTGFTLAPEAGTDRLRRVINKGITEDDLVKTCIDAFGLGWKLIKLYFMFGLPTETKEDIEAIPYLAHKILKIAGRGGRKINVSAATFVPKPHTPFQWEPQLSIDEGFEHIGFLRDRLRGKRFGLKWQDPRQSFLEGVFARGDRRLSELVEAAWRLGARLDAWSDHYDLGIWQRAAEECGIDLSRYLRRREVGAPLPWQHLDTGVNEDFYQTELIKAANEEYTPDCRVHGCQECGVCDFETVMPLTFEDTAWEPGAKRKKDASDGGRPDLGKPHFVYKLTYSRLESARFLGHLELIQVFYRMFRRLQLPLHFSQGFNPSPKVSFSPALPLGTESLAEYVNVDLYEPVKDFPSLLRELNDQLPEGFKVTDVQADAGKQTGRVETCYRIELSRPAAENDCAGFMKMDNFPVSVLRKGKLREVDARPLVKELSLAADGKIEIVLFSETGMAGLKPIEVVSAIAGLTDEEARTVRVLKVWVREEKAEK